MANRNVAHAVRVALVTASALSAGLYGATSVAQEQLEEIVVTGSRIASANATSISPVVTVGGDDFAMRGVTRVEDILNTLPQAFASQGAFLANGSFGTANVNLRNMGSVRTLVLVNGRRLPPGDPRQGGQADLNTIPASLIDRVEVLTGGASAVYGADAVSGVVNFIMDDKFEGIRIDGQYGFYNHKNDNAAAEVVRDRGFPLPKTNVNDGYNQDWTIVMGTNTQDGRGNATAYFNYSKVKPILQANRDYSACTFNSGSAAGGPFTCGGSSTSATGRFWDTDELTPEGTTGLTVADAAGNWRLFNAATDQFNYGPYNHFMRPMERYLGGAFLHYDLNDRVTAYAEMQFMDARDNSQIAPSGIFFDPVSQVNEDNPLINDAFRNIFCVPYDVEPGGDCGVLLGRRNVEGGPRNEDRNHQMTRFVAGFRGNLTDSWTFDIYGMQGVTTYDSTYNNDLSKQRIARALQVVPDPDTGEPVCKSVLDGTDLACVPWDIFHLGGVTEAQTNYLAVPGMEKGQTQTRVLSASVAGDFGWQIPMASDPIGFAFGAETRSETLKYQPDLAYLTDELTGQGGASPPVRGSFEVNELFMEARLPIIQGQAGFYDLSADVGYRFSDYSTGANTDTYKVGLDWAPIESLRFRASYQHAVRAPNIQELFSPQSVALDGSSDPCAGANPAANNPNATPANCALTGVPIADYGSVRENPAQQYNGLLGGNPDLKPEEGDTYSVGFVWNPSFAPGLMVSLDYFNIEIKDAVGIIGADIILSKCLATQDPTYCSLVNRDSSNSIWLSKQGYVEDLNVNTGGAKTEGFDLSVRYGFDIGGAGRLTLDLAASIYDNQSFQSVTGEDFYDCLGYYGNTCGAPASEYRHRFTAAWNTPLEGLDLNVTWRYGSSTKVELESPDPQLSGTARDTDRTLPAPSYVDLAASYQFMEKYTARMGINNLLDEDPGLTGQRVCPTGQCNGNTWPSVFDIGRSIFFSVSAEF